MTKQWQKKAHARFTFLAQQDAIFGLTPSEEMKLKRYQALLRRPLTGAHKVSMAIAEWNLRKLLKLMANSERKAAGLKYRKRQPPPG